MTNNPVAQPDGVVEVELIAWHIVRNALGSEGSKVIFDSAAGRVEWCPNDSRCNGTPDHDPDCWLGQAMRLIPTSDTLPPPTPDSIAEKAARVTRKIINGLPYEVAQHVNRQLLTTIITTEFGAGGEQGEK